ncbi:hypothetical protein EV121DRAFT_265542 [Schizophyllum commune]
MSSASSHRPSRHKRQHPSKNKDDDHHDPHPTSVHPTDTRSLSGDTRTDSHTRMYHASSHDDGYRASKRGRFESKDSGSSSRWRPPVEEDVYAYGRDDYRSRGRDDFPMTDVREADYHGSRYPQPSRSWYPDYNTGPSSPSAPVSIRESWGAAAVEPVYDEGYGWTPDLSQSRRSDERRSGDGWRGKGRKEDDGKKYTSDAGWDTRRRAREEQKRPDRPADDDRDRMWEPAPGWKSAHNGELYEERLREQGIDPKYSKHKNKGKKNKQKRARESGGSGGAAGFDDDLNNWSRRDSRAARYPSPSHSRKHHHSTSPPRSSSYDELHGRPRRRSPSRSISPPASKRARHDRPHDDDRGRPRKIVYERPPSPAHSRPSPPRRRRSISSRSRSTSRSRSRSRTRSISPYARPRQLHRLPTATTTVLSPTNKAGEGVETSPRQKRNGKYQSNGKGNKQKRTSDEASFAISPPRESMGGLRSFEQELIRSSKGSSETVRSGPREPLPERPQEFVRESSRDPLASSSSQPPPRESQQPLKHEGTQSSTTSGPQPVKEISPAATSSTPAAPIPVKPVTSSMAPEAAGGSSKTKVPPSANLPPKPKAAMAPPFRADTSPQPMAVDAPKGETQAGPGPSGHTPEATLPRNSPTLPQPVSQSATPQPSSQPSQPVAPTNHPLPAQPQPQQTPAQMQQMHAQPGHPLPLNPALMQHPYNGVPTPGLPQRPMQGVPYMYPMPGMPGMPGMSPMPYGMPGMPGFPGYPYGATQTPFRGPTMAGQVPMPGQMPAQAQMPGQVPMPGQTPMPAQAPFPQPRPVNPPPVQAPPVIVPADPKAELAKGANRPRKAGFKPIGFAPIKHQAKPNAALKKFFTGEDEDMDMSDDAPAPAPAPASAEPTPTAEPPAQTTPRPATDPTPPATADSRTPTTGPPTTHPTSPPEKVLPIKEAGPSDAAMAPAPPPVSAPTTSSEKSELYSIVSQVGEGTFGKVYKAMNNVSKNLVALKRIRMETERDGFPVTAMREIKLLQSLKHENVIRLYEMMVSNAHVYMVFQYMDHDLTGILSQHQFSFTEAHLKSLCYQMLAGLAYLHHKGVIHRDIKGSNILVNNRGELKLADFGLARFYHKRRRADYTNRVITLWYRPPELLLGATMYGPEVDMWSAGCIMLELFTKKPVFQGDDEIHQLDVIYKVMGTPTAERWPGVHNLPWYELVKPKEPVPNHFREYFKKWMSPPALDLAELLLAYDPGARATATQAMEASYFKQDPQPELPSGLSTLEGEWHELETKRERARRKKETRTGTQ